MPVIVVGALALLILALAARGLQAATAPPRSGALPRGTPAERALMELRREQPPAAPTPEAAPPAGPPLPADVVAVVRDISDGVVNEHTEQQIRQAALSAASAGFGEIASELALHAASVAELSEPDIVKPQAVIDALSRVTTATAEELRAAAEYALQAQLYATMAMLRFRAQQIESGRHPSGPAVADQQTVAAAASDVRTRRATAVQLGHAAGSARRLGLANEAARFAEAMAALERPATPTPPPATPPSPAIEPLRRGSRGDQVRVAQRGLLGLGYDLGRRRDDGKFGEKTELAVRAFQRDRGLPVTGVIDVAFWLSLREAIQLATARSPSAATGAEPRLGAVEPPWADVSVAQWARFLLAMKAGPPELVTPKGHLGMFRYDPRRLEDMRILKSVRQQDGKRAGEFRRPMTEAAWLRPDVQIAVFTRDVKRMRQLIGAEHPRAIGQMHAGRMATMSGLLAVAHAAGPAKLASWLASADDDPAGDKVRFVNGTTSAYLRATGIF